MKKNILISALIISFVFIGCAKRNDSLKGFKNTNQSPMAIQYTKKRDLIYNGSLKVMVFGTYLNKISKKYETDKLDSFVVGIHIKNQENHDLVKNRFEVTLNNDKPKTMVKVSNDSDIVEIIPLKNQWADYYLIHFDNKKDVTELNLRIIHPVYGSVSLNFQK
jgi:hypothetical protein